MDIFLPPSKRSDQLQMFWCNYFDTHTYRYTCIDSSSEMTSHTPESCINARDSIYNLVILGNNKDWEWWSFLKEGITPSKLTSREALSVKKTKQALDRMPHSTQDEKRAPACKHPSGKIPGSHSSSWHAFVSSHPGKEKLNRRLAMINNWAHLLLKISWDSSPNCLMQI